MWFSHRDCEPAGQQVRRIGSGFGDTGEIPTLTGFRCASVNGFSLYANTQVPAHRRDQLERLIRYTAHGAVSLERLAQDANGDLVYTFTYPWSDGTMGIRLSPNGSRWWLLRTICGVVEANNGPPLNRSTRQSLRHQHRCRLGGQSLKAGQGDVGHVR